MLDIREMVVGIEKKMRMIGYRFVFHELSCPFLPVFLMDPDNKIDLRSGGFELICLCQKLTNLLSADRTLVTGKISQYDQDNRTLLIVLDSLKGSSLIDRSSNSGATVPTAGISSAQCPNVGETPKD